ncbi:aminotransferase class I/II-fold pyridoxal phosphate-dependent enzyme [archaeon]|nr:MAG: aminotransferase class I/II-fold pyridoxal phosphate-dependent enzyme [archaeon]
MEGGDLARLIGLYRAVDAYLLVDQTYYFSCGYDKTVHMLSMSKVFGMPGWRVGMPYVRSSSRSI